jgi:hypothetical protein
MATHTTSETTTLGPDPAAQFLRDLNVLLDIDYADPQRPPLQALAPQFAFHADLPAGERIVASFKAVQRTAQGVAFLDTVSEALKRCANTNLGLDRSLLVVDIAHSICAESFSDELWQRLMLRQTTAEQPHWLRALALRLSRWDDHVSLPALTWQRVIRGVHPTGFEPLVRWGIRQSAPEHDSGKFGLWLIGQARHVLSDHAIHFLSEEVGLTETASALDEFEDSLGANNPRTPPALESQAASDDAPLRADLRRQQEISAVDPDLWQGPADYRPVVAGPTHQVMA